jgi:hypothetical protein
MIEMEEDGIDAKFKQIFEYVQHGKYPNVFSNDVEIKHFFPLI